ncbi:MAG TPA: potassium transporter Kup [Thermoanaerobaculia bacterium]|nr:potassium transporter Kup [Thermoanaerobaculia bacterium]
MEERPSGGRLALLCLGALGVVYGDIGTSPLYSMRECFNGEHAVAPRPENVLGILSLIFWALVITVTLKYVVYVLRADNRGEGGILALMALVQSAVGKGRRNWILVLLGLFGSALLYGDGMITPAISVLSAVEGLKVATPFFTPYIEPITIAILIGLFILQRRGTGGIGAIFGPVMLLWFATLAVLGISWIWREPRVLAAVDPLHALSFFAHQGKRGYLVLGSVFLVATGGEALYADMGHFGARPIQIDWFSFVAPALLLNYFGQGALLMLEPHAAREPFYRMAPDWALYPLVVLSTIATVIASQAVISGAFSLTRQAVQLGYLPRVEIIHTSSHEIGQIYIPGVNRILMLATIGLVLGFHSSDRLASAYGVAVTATMVITTILAFILARRVWHWPLWIAGLITLGFLTVDLAFFGANVFKVADGGWFPLAVGLAVYSLMSTWQKGREQIASELSRGALPFSEFVAHVKPGSPHRVPGAAIFMSRDPVATPIALLHNLKHNKVLHEKVVLLTVLSDEIPQIPRKERVRLEDLGKGFFRLTARFGFMENPSVPEVMELARAQGLDLPPMSATFFLSRETLIPSRRSGWLAWREKLFAVMARNAVRPNDFYRIPPNRVIELGMQVKL